MSTEKDFDFSIRNKETIQLLKNFINDYETNKNLYVNQINDTISFHHILKNISRNFEEERDREKIIFENYVYLKDIFHLETKKQLVKYGFFHLQKEREQKEIEERERKEREQQEQEERERKEKEEREQKEKEEREEKDRKSDV